MVDCRRLAKRIHHHRMRMELDEHSAAKRWLTRCKYHNSVISVEAVPSEAQAEMP